MKTLRKIIPAFICGVGIGALIECLFTVIYGQIVVGTPEFIAAHPSPVFVKLIQTLLYGGFGLVSLLGSKVFSIKNNSLFKATALNFLLILAYFTFTGFYLRWFPSTPSFFLSLIFFILIYLIIWTLIYLSEKRKIEEINHVLRENQIQQADK